MVEVASKLRSGAAFDEFVSGDITVYTHRMAFPKVDARRTNGHVQGVAALFDERCETLYASLSDFPAGWGGCLIESSESSMSLEAMAIPQGRHPGGINVCDEFMCVPVEHPGRYGRLYFYDLKYRLYPRQAGAFDHYAIHGGSVSGDSEEDVPGWVSCDGARPTKASAAAMARMGPDWKFGDATAKVGERGECSYLVAVLSQNRYLRFCAFAADESRDVEPKPFGPNHANQPVCFDTKDLDGWPKKTSGATMVDNISLINTDDGLRLVVFSAQGLIPLVRAQGKWWRWKTRDVIDVFKVSFSDAAPDRAGRTVTLEHCANGEMVWPNRTSRRFGELCWPSFRWGASMSWPDDERFETPVLIVAEFFGDEDRDWLSDRQAPAKNWMSDGAIQYLQFACNHKLPHFGTERDADARQLRGFRRRWRLLSDTLRMVGAVARHWLDDRRQKQVEEKVDLS